MRFTPFYFICLFALASTTTSVVSTPEFATSTPLPNCGPIKNVFKCHCQGTVAKCSNRNLTEIPVLPENVTNLIFSYNNLKTLSAASFKRINPSSIIKLDLTSNNITLVEEGVFSEFRNMEKLALNENRHIDNVSLKNAFKSLHQTKISVLHLVGMNLNKIGNITSALSPLSGLNLTEISLKYNRLNQFEDKVFRDVQSLNILDLSNNFLTHEGFKRTGLANITELNLYWNDFFIWVPWLCDKDHMPFYPNLQQLNVTTNSIQLLYKAPWQCAKSLTKIYLDYNPIHIIENNTFSHLTSLKTVSLRHMYNPFMSISEKAFDSESLQHIHLDWSYLEIKKYNIKLLFSSTPNLTYLSLSYNILWNLNSTDYVDLLFNNTRLETLNLEECQIHTLQVSSVFENLKQLKTLILSRNSIPKIDFSVFGKLPNLKTLDLSKSFIQQVVDNGKNPGVHTSLNVLDISGNKFSCQCDENIWFRKFLRTNMHIVNKTKPFKCGSPHQLEGKNFLEVDGKEDCHPFLAVEIAVACVFTFVFLTVAIAAFQGRWYILYWIYKLRRGCARRRHGFQPITDPFCYDGYVVYHEDDRKFVHGPLLDIVENQNHFRLFIPLRDSLPGEPKVDSICNNICKSRKILIVLSNNFLTDSWCKFQLDVVIDRQVELGQEIMFMILLNTIDASKMQSHCFCCWRGHPMLHGFLQRLLGTCS